MTRYIGAREFAAVAFFVAGIAFALPSGTWIEKKLGLDLDAGSGALEFLLAAIPVAIGIALAASVAVRRRRTAVTPAVRNQS